MKNASPNSSGKKPLFVIVAGFLTVISLQGIAQQKIDVYYFKNEVLSTGNRLTYISAGEMYSSEPKQFIVRRGRLNSPNRDSVVSPIPVLPLSPDPSTGQINSRLNSPQAHSIVPAISALSLSPDPSTGQINIRAPYQVSAAKIAEKGGQTVMKKLNINSKSFMIDISCLKTGLYILEIVSLAEESSEKKIRKKRN